ncbi:MAG: deoxyribonuclease V [Rhodothermales bacterium]
MNKATTERVYFIRSGKRPERGASKMDFELYHGHDWDVSTAEAVEIQRALAERLRFESLAVKPETLAGVDVSFRRLGYKEYAARCGVVVLSFPELEQVDSARWSGRVTFPYVPGLLSFRELPAVLNTLDGLSVRPDVIMTDGHGYAHPRRMGLACHLGLALNLPTFGVAKSRLTGTHVEPGGEKGSTTPLLDGGEVIGMVVRTRTDVNPVFVSAGHLITLEEAVDLAIAAAPRYKIPEPTRAAHRLSRA